MADLFVEINDRLKTEIRAIAELENCSMKDVVVTSINDFIDNYADKDKVKLLADIKEDK